MGRWESYLKVQLEDFGRKVQIEEIANQFLSSKLPPISPVSVMK